MSEKKEEPRRSGRQRKLSERAKEAAKAKAKAARDRLEKKRTKSEQKDGESSGLTPAKKKAPAPGSPDAKRNSNKESGSSGKKQAPAPGSPDFEDVADPNITYYPSPTMHDKEVDTDVDEDIIGALMLSPMTLSKEEAEELLILSSDELLCQEYLEVGELDDYKFKKLLKDDRFQKLLEGLRKPGTTADADDELNELVRRKLEMNGQQSEGEGKSEGEGQQSDDGDLSEADEAELDLMYGDSGTADDKGSLRLRF